MDKRDAAGGFFIQGQVQDTVATHTAADVPLTADGLGAPLFHGVLDNTDVFFRLAGAVLRGVPGTVARTAEPTPSKPARTR